MPRKKKQPIPTETDVAGAVDGSLAHERRGGCFVVGGPDGRVWDGMGWVKTWPYGMKYRRPGPAYEMCEQERLRVEGLTGQHCYVAYIHTGLSPRHELHAPALPIVRISHHPSRHRSP